MFLIEAKRSEKKAHVERLLEKGTVMVFIDARRSDVRVPVEHQGNPQLALNLDYSFNIPDFSITEEQIEASLSFNRNRFFCVLPMSAIYAVRSEMAEEVILFLEDVPSDFTFARTQAEGSLPKKSGPQLTALETPENLEATDEAKPAETPKKAEGKPASSKKKKPHLRLIKS